MLAHHPSALIRKTQVNDTDPARTNRDIFPEAQKSTRIIQLAAQRHFAVGGAGADQATQAQLCGPLSEFACYHLQH